MTTDPVREAAREGREARLAGKALEDNPHTAGSARVASAWEDGWRSADDPARDSKNERNDRPV